MGHIIQFLRGIAVLSALFCVDVTGAVSWQFGEQAGATTSVNGEITTDGLSLNSWEGYKARRRAMSKRPVTTNPPVTTKPPGAGGGGKIVYSRVPRTLSTTMTVGGESVEVQNLDVWDALPEVSRMFSDFSAPGQMVLRDGEFETIIYDCVSENLPCVPFDAAWSLDGKRIAFTVYRSDELRHRNLRANETLPNWYLSSKGRESQICIYTVAARATSCWPHNSGVQDTSPIWLPDDRMMFSSDRSGQYRPWLNAVTPKNARMPRLFTANLDGTGVVDISPHEFAGAMHPWLLSSGRVAYSSHWMSHNLPYISTNGGVNWHTTIDNMWMMADIDHEGGDMTALLGSHRKYFRDGAGRGETMKALHFIGQRENGDVCTTNYYRANNLGQGDVLCHPLGVKGVEGPAPMFLPTGLYSLAYWSKSNDETNTNDDRAKIGFPEGLADGQMMVSMGTGWCSTVAYDLKVTPGRIGDRKGCDVGLYKTTVIPSEVISDMQVIVDHPEWHEFNARVKPFREYPVGELVKSGTDACYLASSDAGSTDSRASEYKFNKMYHNAANNGAELYGVDHAEMTGIRFYEAIPNTDYRPTFKNHMGNEMRLLGDVNLLSDGSFKVQLPCETPFLMAGIDSDGLIIKRDQVPMSLRRGEERVCTGCHLHGEEGRPYEQSLAYHVNATELLESTPVPTWTNEIQPIIQEQCSACHTHMTAYKAVVWDYVQKMLPEDDRLQVSSSAQSHRKYGLHRPQTSKYVDNMFARKSLLYWKAAGERSDGMRDSDYPDDIDFGKAHPKIMDDAQLRMLGHWLDSGAAQ